MDARNSKLKWVDEYGYTDWGAGNLLIAELWDITHGHRVAVITKELLTRSYSLHISNPQSNMRIEYHSTLRDLQSIKDLAVAIARLKD
jgi:hypothetical protein